MVTKNPKKFVRYIGLSDVRELTVADFKRIDVDDQMSKVSWSRDNGWRIPADDLSANAVKFLETEPDFRIEDEEQK